MIAAGMMQQRFPEAVYQRQDEICRALSQIDGKPFHEDTWTRTDGGGGRTRVLEGGDVLEKAGVNVSVVHGKLPPDAVKAMGGGERFTVTGDNIDFFAAGISLVLHPRNPMAPTTHANYRYFELSTEGQVATWWFGGGADLTPYYLFEEDATHFHRVHKDACDQFDQAYYPRFKKWCDEYFFVRHRGESRGVGGIFFDDLRGDQETTFAFSSACSAAFLPAYQPILERRMSMPYTESQKAWQEARRGRYVEFNLVYDRGTTFGLRTGGRIESILMSLPPVTRWPYNFSPADGSDEARLVDALRKPRAWV